MTISATGAGARVRLGREEEFGTPATGDYFNVPYAPPVDIGSVQELIDDPLLGQGRDPLDPEYGAEDAGGSINVPVDLNYTGLWLSGLLGDADTTPADGETPAYYDHVFTSGGLILPSWSIEIAHPRIGKYAMNTGYKVNSYALNLTRAGQALAQIGLIGQKEVWSESSGAGTPVVLPLERFSQFQGTLTRNGTPLGSVLSASMNFTNNLDPVGPIANNGLIDGLDDGMTGISGDLQLRFRDDTLLSDAMAKTPIALEFGFANGANKFLKFHLPRVFLPKPKAVIDGPGGIDATYQWSAFRDAVAGYAMRVTLRNQYDGAAYAVADDEEED